MENNKTHYRKVFKSDHLGVADLEEYIEQGRSLVFTIQEVRQEFGAKVAGRTGNHNIAYFADGIKPMVLNATNCKLMKKFNKGSSFVDDWKNTTIELYIDHNVKMKGDIVGGVRIKPVQPVQSLPVLTKDHKRYDDAKKAWKDGKQDGVRSQFQISKELETELSA